MIYHYSPDNYESDKAACGMIVSAGEMYYGYKEKVTCDDCLLFLNPKNYIIHLYKTSNSVYCDINHNKLIKNTSILEEVTCPSCAFEAGKLAMEIYKRTGKFQSPEEIFKQSFNRFNSLDE